MSAGNGKSNGKAPEDDWDPEEYEGLADEYRELAAALESGPLPPPVFIDGDSSLAYFATFKLRTILTRPRRHELICPGAGQRVVLTTEDLLSVPRFTAAFVDEVGSFPPLPKKDAAKLWRSIVKNWLENRETVDVGDEGSQFGLLAAEIQRSLLAASETDDPADLAHGGVLVLQDGDRLFSPRPIMVRVRAGGLVQFRAGEFYAGLRELGCEQHKSTFVRGQRTRAWRAPAVLWLQPPKEDPEPAGGAPPPNGNGASGRALALH